MNRRLVATMISLSIMICFVACSNRGSMDETLQKATNDTNKKKLNIYVLENTNNTHRIIDKAVGLFNDKFTDIQIEQEVCSYNHKEDYYNKLSTQLLAGEGLDIPIFEVDWGMDSRISIPKILQSEVLYDVNDLIKNDKAFKYSDYVKKVLDSRIYKGKRYIIPIGFNIHSFYVKKGELEKNDISIDPSKWSLNYLASIADTFRSQNENNNKYLFFSSAEYLFYSLMQSSGISLVDYEKKESRFNSSEFVNILKFFKEKFYPVLIPSKVLTSGTNWTCMMYELSSYLSQTEWHSLSDKDNLDFYTMPTYKGESCIFLDPCYFVGVTNKCKYKKEAFEFIKILLSEEVQDYNKYFPVNIKSYMKKVSVRFKNIDAGAQDAGVQLKAIENTGRSMIFDNSVHQVIKKELNEYIAGRKSEEQTAKTINDKVNLYLNE